MDSIHGPMRNANQCAAGSSANGGFCIGMISIPAAVYTARSGYEWTELPSWISTADADEWHREINRLKASIGCELKDGEALEGVLYKRGNDYAVAFRMFLAKRWDQANRDASYCACGFVKREHLGKVDFGKILKHRYFIEPDRNPGGRIECVPEKFGNAENSSVQKVLHNVSYGKKEAPSDEEDWRVLGLLLENYGDSNAKWHFLRKVSRHRTTAAAEFGEWNQGCNLNLPGRSTESGTNAKEHCAKIADDPNSHGYGNGGINSRQCKISNQKPNVKGGQSVGDFNRQSAGSHYRTDNERRLKKMWGESKETFSSANYVLLAICIVLVAVLTGIICTAIIVLMNSHTESQRAANGNKRAGSASLAREASATIKATHSMRNEASGLTGGTSGHTNRHALTDRESEYMK